MELAEENTEEFYSFIRFTRRNKMRIQENVPPLPLKKLQRRNTDGKLKDESLSLSLFALDVFPAELFFFFFFLFHETRYPDREKKRRRKNKRGKEQNRK